MAIAVIKSATNFIGSNIRVLFIPPFLSIILMGWFAFWVVIFVLVYSIGEPIPADQRTTPFNSLKWNKDTRYMLIFWVFGGLWTCSFILAIKTLILSSITSIWYFGKRDDDSHYSVITSIYRTFRFHLGSLAFGSLLISIIRFFRIFLILMDKYSKVVPKNNDLVKCTLTCLSCCLSCFDRFIKFITENCYIMIALNGESFCSSSK